MFAKLLKHEWKANAGLLGILSLATMGVSVLVTVLLRFATSGAKNVPDAVWAPVWVLIVGGFLSIVAYAMAVHIILLVRFYKNKFTNEGYLTFTLPAGTHQILLSSLLNYLIWAVISTAVTVVALGIPVLAGPKQEGLINLQIFDMVKEVLHWMPQETIEYLLLNLVSMVLTALSSIVLIHTAIVLGAVVAKKHKILAAFGMYYGINMVLGMVTSVMTVSISVANILQEDAYGAMNGITLAQMLIYVVVAVAGYFVSHYLMKNKLNLP